jgi:N-acetylmuramoyl-L-alanine amidase
MHFKLKRKKEDSSFSIFILKCLSIYLKGRYTVMNLWKKIKSRLVLVVILAATLLIYNIVPVLAMGLNNDTNNKKIILIDPGHGGYDGGAEGKSGIKEKDINLSISLKLKNRLLEEGYEVYMIREEDKSLLGEGKRTGTKKAQDMDNRCKIKEKTNPDIL